MTAPTLDGSESDVATLRPGETLAGRFSIVRFIARGGMGAVYEANDSVLRTRVALKLIGRRIAQNGTAMERFRQEVLLARQVSHPNVCRVHELYEGTTASGEHIQFLSMELLQGETLARKLGHEGRSSSAEALPLVEQMCAGLAAAHAQGVIHRDFKTGNVMLVRRADASGDSTERMRVVITDFGLARAFSAPAGEEALTGDGGVLGTPAYMAPEQVTGGELTPATDIYALGVVLYEMLTGKLPFVGDTPLAAAACRLNEAPPRPELTVPGLDPRWSKTILRCLAREPNQRFRSALDVADALSASRRPRRTVLVLAGVAALLLLGAFAAARALPRFRGEKPRVGPVLAVRPVAAILGIASRLPDNRLAWLPTAIEEGLHHELAAAETSLRILPTDRVARARRSLDIREEALSEVGSRSRLQGLLGANHLIHGEVALAEPGSQLLDLRLHLLDGPSGQQLASFSAALGLEAAQLPQALARLGTDLREALHAPLSSEEESALVASRMKSLDAAQAYAEGVSSLRAFDYPQARIFFETALAHDSTLVDAQQRILESWHSQGFRRKAQEMAERVASQTHLLTSRQLEDVASRALRLGADWQKGLDARRALFEKRPDDEELGFEVASDNAPATQELTLVRRLRQLPAPMSEDLRLDAAEAEAVWSEDRKRAHELLDRLERRARELGARSEQALAHQIRAANLWGPSLEEVAPYREAIRLYSEGGDLQSAAIVMGQLANALSQHGSQRDALTALDESAAAFRRLGNRSQLHELLSFTALGLWGIGNGELASRRLEEARQETELLGEPPSDTYLWVRPKLLCWNADIAGCRAAVLAWRRFRGPDDWAVLLFEAQILREEDRLEEARSSIDRGLGPRRRRGLMKVFLCALDCDQRDPAEGLACLSAIPQPKVDAQRPAELVALWYSTEARCKYRSRDFSGAERAARQALTASGPDFIVRIPASIDVARAMAANGQRAKAISDLRRILAEIESARLYKRYAFEAELALGEAELAAAMPAGRARLVRLEREAKEREHFRIARLAREALDRARPGRGN